MNSIQNRIIENIMQGAEGGYWIIGTHSNPYMPQEGDDYRAKLQVNDVLIARLNKEKTLLWAKQIEKPGYDFGVAIAPMSDGGAVFSTSFDEAIDTNISDVALTKISKDGEIQWCTSLGSAGLQDVFDDMVVVADDSVTLVGSQKLANGTKPTIRIVNIDNSGTAVWDKMLNSKLATQSPSGFLKQDHGGYLLFAKSASRGVLMFEIGPNGELPTQKRKR